MSSVMLARKISASSTFSAWKKIPHVSFIFDLDISHFYTAYQKEKEVRQKTKYPLSFNTCLVKCIAETLAGFPKLFASFSYNSLSHKVCFEYTKTVDINIPWILPDGTMVPFLFKNLANTSLEEFSSKINTLKERIPNLDLDREMLKSALEDTRKKLKKFKLSALSRVIPLCIVKKIIGYKDPHKHEAALINPEGIIISNAGSLMKDLKGRFGMLEIIEPKVLALGLGAFEDKLAYEPDTNQVSSKKILPLTLAFDHRALDFGDVVPFIKELNKRLSSTFPS